MKIARLNSEAEIFYSLQGEGARSGTPAVFVRLAGCNLNCSWCDTPYSRGTGIELSVEEVAERITAYACAGLVITGGEPMLQAAELECLLELLPEHIFVEVETNGTIPPTDKLARRVNQWNVSPKLAHSGNKTNTALRTQVLQAFYHTQRAWFKFVVQAEQDWADIARLGLPQERIILMPCATTAQQLMAARPLVAELCIRHRVRFGDRLHIALWNDKKGV